MRVYFTFSSYSTNPSMALQWRFLWIAYLWAPSIWHSTWVRSRSQGRRKSTRKDLALLRYNQQYPPRGWSLTDDFSSEVQGSRWRLRTECTIQERDLVWLYLIEDRFKGEAKKLKPILYNPFKIPKKIGDKAFQLDLLPYMRMHFVINQRTSSCSNQIC